jgi:hypothetical protein
LVSLAGSRSIEFALVGVERRRVVWTLRICARRERHLAIGERFVTEAGLATWRSFAGRLHEGDLVSALIENNAVINPLALRPLAVALSRDEGLSLLDEALSSETHLLSASTATFLESAAIAFGRPPLGTERRSAFEPIRSTDQRVLELPSTAARVASTVAPAGAPLETYVGYVIADEDDSFLVGLTMLEFDRNAAPTLVHFEDLRAGTVSGAGTFSRAATLGAEEHILELLPVGMVARVVTL